MVWTLNWSWSQRYVDLVVSRSGVLGLFGLNTLPKDLTEIVLTSTEMDALAVYQETKAPVLALPAGFSSLPQEVLCCFGWAHELV